METHPPKTGGHPRPYTYYPALTPNGKNGKNVNPLHHYTITPYPGYTAFPVNGHLPYQSNIA